MANLNTRTKVLDFVQSGGGQDPLGVASTGEPPRKCSELHVPSRWQIVVRVAPAHDITLDGCGAGAEPRGADRTGPARALGRGNERVGAQGPQVQAIGPVQKTRSRGDGWLLCPSPRSVRSWLACFRRLLCASRRQCATWVEVLRTTVQSRMRRWTGCGEAMLAGLAPRAGRLPSRPAGRA